MIPSINPQVIAKCMSTPFSVLIQKNADSMGDRPPDVTNNYLCFFKESNEMVINNLGVEELSGAQLYVTGTVITGIPNTSLITCKDRIKKRIIRKDSWDLPGGATGLAVIYLP